MSSARIGAFSQRVAQIIVQREVAVTHEGGDFQNMKVLVSLFSVSGCQQENPFILARAWDPQQETYTYHSQRARQEKCSTLCVRVLRKGGSRPSLYTVSKIYA